MLIYRKGDNCAKGFLPAINSTRTCRTVRDVGLRVPFPPHLTIDSRKSKAKTRLDRPLEKTIIRTPAVLGMQMQLLEMRCFSRLFFKEAYRDRLIEPYRKVLDDHCMDGWATVWDAILVLMERLVERSGRNVTYPLHAILLDENISPNGMIQYVRCRVSRMPKLWPVRSDVVYSSTGIRYPQM